ncbi:YggS family pyridoxal phosphate-dependent enzyme [Deinococcus peraridilitoris]|uniref:Pyridoxal phosphate enzyme, YggS family n=1 Tax=Deinococcus peraridilitoris (strain DSM 19664 / LMG 22246 / CIP 109416 / KR-200) TaxID=937777 RepID=K9ZY92_DEIPD|nr:YggS family pyridoxal phosphate-dependent enzyme [Deinococcus peraridilitoris]AFZ65720.1 pyridoxal phosphate enzyme, YggS family [Deinococcus peraridilitoris DSM 19664]
MGLPEVLAHIRAAEAGAGRSPGSVRLVAVTKGHGAPEIRECVLSHGTFALGESKGQELRDKRAELGLLGLHPQWHFIGALQTNKLKYLQGVSLVHSLTRRDHAAELARLGDRWGDVPDVLLQVHNGEAQKQGVAPGELRAVYHEVSQLGLRVRGLMVMAPEGDRQAAHRIFRDTAARAHELGLSELSMGMSDDYAEAIGCGATLVRVGRALFMKDTAQSRTVQ